MKIFIAWLGTMLAFANIALSQIEIKVQDAGSLEPLFSALIHGLEGKATATTNNFGTAYLSQLNIGDEVEISYLGYETMLFKISSEKNIVLLQQVKQGIDEVLVTATRVGKKGVFATENFTAERIRENNLGQDLPILLNQAASVVTSTDAGNGVGYTGIRVRGSDPTRINVTINGIPVNDAESQGVFWVNFPDLASSTNSIQIQRGLGTSTNGPGAFGATINLQTDVLQSSPYAQASAAVGSFNTQKYSFKAGTGLIDDIWTADLRWSKIQSDGYIDRASSDLSSFYLSTGAYMKKDVVKFIAFTGKEKTYQAWNGVYEGDLQDNRTYNYTGAYTDAEGNEVFHHDESDNYWQDNFQLHWAHIANSNLEYNFALHYTKGRGYFEQYREDEDMENYGLAPISIGNETISTTDLIRRRWLDNDFGGAVFSLNYSPVSRTKLTLGGGANRYFGDHFGRVIWAQYASNSSIEHEYYFDNAIKTDVSVYAKMQHDFTEKLSGFVDLQYRNIFYLFTGFNSRLESVDQEAKFNFFNPKGGVFYQINDASSAFLSVSHGNKEPNRNDFTESSENTRALPEKLTDYEAGWSWTGQKSALKLTSYLMNYKDQLILSGKINDVGEYSRTNVDKSYRMGIEVEATAQLTKKLTVNGNLTLSKNKIASFTEYIDDYDGDYNYLGQQDINHEDTDISFSPSLIAGAVATYKLSNYFSAELQSKYVGKQFLDNTMNDSRKLDGFHVANLRIFGKLPVKRMQPVQWNVLVNNVFNHLYSNNGYTYGYAVGGVREDYNYVFPQAGINFLAGLQFGF